MELVGALGFAPRVVQALTKPAERLFQIMRDIGGRLIDVLDQSLQVAEHTVHLQCHLVDIVLLIPKSARAPMI